MQILSGLDQRYQKMNGFFGYRSWKGYCKTAFCHPILLHNPKSHKKKEKSSV